MLIRTYPKTLFEILCECSVTLFSKVSYVHMPHVNGISRYVRVNSWCPVCSCNQDRGVIGRKLILNGVCGFKLPIKLHK